MPCLVVQRHVEDVPRFLVDDASARLHLEALDIGDREALRELGERYPIDGIVHLAAPAIGGLDALTAWQMATSGTANVLAAARDWEVGRVVAASTIGVYAGVGEGPFAEKRPLPMSGAFAIPAFKKCAEIVADLVANTDGLDVACVRIGAIWGPLGHPRSPFFALPQLVHSAVAGGGDRRR